MEQKKNTPEKTAYTGRFGDSSTAEQPKAAMPRKKHTENPARTPSGFSAAGQQPRRKSAPRPESKPAEEEKTSKKPKKEKKPRQKSKKEPRRQKEKSGCALRLLVTAAVVVLAVLLAIVVFGDKGTYHQMPVVEREAEAVFAPEQTPIPSPEVS